MQSPGTGPYAYLLRRLGRLSASNSQTFLFQVFFFNLPKNFWESLKFCVSMINNHRVFLATTGYITKAGANQTHGNPPSSAGLQVILIFATLYLKVEEVFIHSFTSDKTILQKLLVSTMKS